MSKKDKQAIAANLLVEGVLHKAVAKTVGVTPQTISAWLNEPNFVATINTIKMDNLNSSRDKLHGLFYAAASTIEDIMFNGESDAVRLKAAKCVIDASGVQSPQSGLWAWGVGPQTPRDVEKHLSQPDLRIGGLGLDIVDHLV